MRLGGPLFGESTDVDSWIKLVKNHGYSAAYCPVSSSASEREAQEYVTAAKENNIVIAEVGAGVTLSVLMLRKKKLLFKNVKNPWHMLTG